MQLQSDRFEVTLPFYAIDAPAILLALEHDQPVLLNPARSVRFERGAGYA